VQELLEENKSRIKRIATARIMLNGKKSMIDYNWSVKMVHSSDMIRDSPAYMIQVDFILMNEKGKHENFVVEFSQEEFAQFVKKLGKSVN
jgi:hypothetical protein